MYHDYYVRALPSDWPTLIALGEKLGVLSVYTDETGAETVSAKGPGCWDFIGVLYKPTGKTLKTPEGPVPEMAPVADGSGTPFWHANLRTTVSLGQVAREMAQTDPKVAAALSSLDRFFLLDAEGNPREPSQPSRAWA
jgi:hypothetical protein